MTKKLILLTVLAVLSLSAAAQVVVQRDLGQQNNSTQQPVKEKPNKGVSTFVYKFGAKAGLNLTSFSNGTEGIDPEFSMGTGFRIGGFANLRWGQRTENSLPGTGMFGLQPEILFSMMQVGTKTESVKLSTLQIPVMVKIYPMNELSIEVGPEFTYVFSTSPDDMTLTPSETSSILIKTGDIKGLNMGVGIGVAHDFDMGLTVGARYSYGFNKLAKNLDWKMSNIQICAGWIF